MSSLPPGPALDALVCPLVEWEPDHWALFDAGGMCAFTKRYSFKSKALEKDAARYGVEARPVWSPVSSDGNAMLKLIAAMHERGWNRVVTGLGEWEQVELIHGPTGRRVGAGAAAMPHAVALAALAALGGQG